MMDRENLFRGKRQDNRDWVFGDLAHSKSGFVFIKDPSNCEYGHWDNGHYCGNHIVDKVDPSTVGRCVAVSDMDGKTAFEGDILLPEGNTPYEVVGIVRFGVWTEDKMEHIGFWVEWDGDYAIGWRGDLGYWLSRSRIIGNIHDNPELFGGGQQ